MLTVCGAVAQQATETVYLKNGSVIKGTVVEQIPGTSLKVKTKDGSVFVYEMSEVERITKDTAESGYSGLCFNADLGYNISTEGGGGSMSAEIGLGKRINKNFYWGVSTGALNITEGDLMIPVATNFKVYFPLGGTAITPFVSMKLGYAINTAEDETFYIGNGKYATSYTVEHKDNIMFELCPGVQIPITGGTDFNLSAGYMHFVPTSGGGGGGAFAVKAGFGFHKNPNKQPRAIVPIRNGGLQLTIEGNGVNPWNIDGESFGSAGVNVMLGYKLNPNISFGLGYGFSYATAGESEVMVTSYSEADAKGDAKAPYPDLHYGAEAVYIQKFFARGQYRLTDKKLSPFASVDLGIRKYSWDSSTERYYPVDQINEEETEIPTSGLFITPAVGLSLRTTNNSYLELRLGYSLSKGLEEKEAVKNLRYGGSEKLTVEKSSMSGMYLSIGWTHTFGTKIKL